MGGNGEKLLRVDQAARRLEKSPQTVRRYLLEGKLQGQRRGRPWQIPESALEALREQEENA
jgi:excisionase family DNA binding protein